MSILSRKQFSSLAGASLLGMGAGLHGEEYDPRKVFPQWTPKAKRIIYLFQSGAPSQIDLFDYKPELKKMFDKDLPNSIRKGQRLTGMTSGQNAFPLPLVFLNSNNMDSPACG